MKKSGKKATYVNSNIYAEDSKKQLDIETPISQIPDSIRYFSSNYWTLDKNELKKADAEKFFDIEYFDNTIVLKAKQEYFFSEYFDNGLLRNKFDKTLWDSFINSILPSPTQTFQDSYINFFQPVNISDRNQQIDTSVSFINKEFIFNFLSKKYENLTSDQIFNVNTLPTVYALLGDGKIGVRSELENLSITLGGAIGDEYTTPLYTANKTSDLLTAYFDEYADVYRDPRITSVIRRLATEGSINSLNKGYIDLGNKLNNKFIPFPFYVSIKFSNYVSEKEDFIHILDSYNELQKDLLNYIQNQYTVKENKYILSSEDNIPTEVSLPYFDLKKWINSNLPTAASPSDVPIFSPSNINNYSNLIEYIKKNIKPKIRKYSKFMEESAPFEILFYKIEKRQFNNNKTNKPINTVYIVPTESELINYFDTQVKYGVDYYYSISAFTLVLTNSYSYQSYYSDVKELEKQKDLSEGLYKINISNSLNYDILEIPMANFFGSIQEKPYNKPKIEIVQNDNKLMFSLQKLAGGGFEKFKVIENNDFKIFEQIRLSQDNPDQETIETVENKSAITKLQIYKTPNTPRTYLDFQNRLYKTLILDENLNNFMDMIETNKKYFYLFRSLNEHDVPSNVSEVFQVELIDEDGYMYLEQKNIDLEAGPEKQNSKGMKRYLLIRPSVIQTQPKYNKNIGSVQDINLGPEGENVWYKDFVVKIKSKKSNRVLKFNIKSKLEKK